MKSFLKYPLLILLTLTLGLRAFAQVSQATAKIDSPSIKIGQQTLLHLFVHGAKTAPVAFPAIKDSLTPKVWVVRPFSTDTVPDTQTAGQQTIRRSYVITAFDAGLDTIPSIKFKVGNDTVSTQPLYLQVKTVKVDTTKAFKEIKQPLVVPYTLWDWLNEHWILVLIFLWLCVVVAGVTIYLQRKRKKAKPEVVEPPKPAIPSHVLAINKLNELRDKKLWQMDFIKEYHVELTDIMRDYLTTRYGINAHEKTTDEILGALRHNLDQIEWTRLQQVFVLADLVKFAKEKPAGTDNEQSMDNAVSFVRAVQPPPEQPKPKEGDADGVA